MLRLRLLGGSSTAPGARGDTSLLPPARSLRRSRSLLRLRLTLRLTLRLLLLLRL
jgi:hypothetical protein